MGVNPLATIAKISARPLGAGWLRLAIASLILAGFTSGLVALGRTPGLQALIGPQGFKIFLAGHVNFSLSVWCLSFICALWALVADLYGAGIPEKLGRPALRLGWVGTAAMAVATVFALGPPALVDYLPLIQHPVFTLGMILFFGGTTLTAIGFLAGTSRGRDGDSGTRKAGSTPELVALRVAAVAQVAAMVALLLATSIGWRGAWATAAWGGGHLLQITNAATLVGGWLLLLRNPALEPMESGGAGPVPQDLRLLRLALPLYLIPCLGVPLLYLVPGETPVGLMGMLTWSAVAVPTVLALLLLGWRAVRRPRFDPSFYSLTASLLLFAAGFGMAMLGMPGDTRVTAHYHGTVGAVTLVFMGLSFQMLPRLGMQLRGASWARVQPMIYGLGLLLLIGGLFWASNYGGQRKVFEAFAHQKGLWGPMLFFGAGAIVGLVGGMAYIVIMGMSVFGRRRLADTAPTAELAHANSCRADLASYRRPVPVAPGSPAALARVAPLVFAMAVCLLMSGTALASSYQLLSTMGSRGSAARTEAPPFTLVDQGGRKVALEDLRGKPVLLTFLYTYCTTACPRILSSIRQSLDKAGTPPGAVEVVAVTVDPERDTPVRLAEYSQAFPASWLFLTGDPAKVGRTWASYKITVDRDEASGRTVAATAHAGHGTARGEHGVAHGEHGAAHGEHAAAHGEHAAALGEHAAAQGEHAAAHGGHDAHAGDEMANGGQPMDHMGHVGYTITHTNKVVVLDSFGRVAAEHSGNWTAQELAGSLSQLQSGAQGRLDSPLLAAVREFLQRCSAFAVQSPFAFFGIVLLIMLPGLILPAFLLRALLISTRA